MLRILFSWLLLSYACYATAEAKPTTSRFGKNSDNASSSSAWLRSAWKDGDPRTTGCWNRPWICNQGESPPFHRRCCGNRCVDITLDVNHCGFCAIRCPFTWQCCFGLCRDINIDPFHCGRCFNRCPFGVPCLFGMCGYAGPLPPRRPCPFPPKPPEPPEPFPPKPPKPPEPPEPPEPFPPKPPKPPEPPEPFPPHPWPHPPKGYQPPAVA